MHAFQGDFQSSRRQSEFIRTDQRVCYRQSQRQTRLNASFVLTEEVVDSMAYERCDGIWAASIECAWDVGGQSEYIEPYFWWYYGRTMRPKSLFRQRAGRRDSI
ncbi:hypothetical protein K443DRAFT_309274 [Laccaria amethystina LaAM-08-1]|uniref:Uncharacterized protein n=1 Tax=Laccaria amethystina LaAM-08-1 TaxID=1095629 RepID=A0A0C9YD51_9AGAR|nr:hypothetical protein K443DRAFT_309274 [Laccaria amethystina LaAM-08-1]